MIEREQHRADAKRLPATLAAHLNHQQTDLFNRIAQTAIERGYARYVPDLHETLRAMVRGISNAMAVFIESGQKAAFHPGEDFESDPLADFLRREAKSLGARGVRSEVLFGLMQQCRAAYRASCIDAGLENQDHCQALLELCFDRLELSLVATWTANRGDGLGVGTFEDWAHLTSSDSAQLAIERVIEQRVAERSKESFVINEQLRRELDQRLRVEEEREICYRELLNSQKLEAVGALAGGVAHDLNNLFQVVRCNLDLLRERADNVSCGMLEEISQVTDRATGLVRQLLLFSRKQPMVRRELDIGEVVRDLLRMLRRVMPDNVRLFSEVEDKLPWVRADLTAIEQLVKNLIINARDSMPRGGTIHVSVCCQRRVPPERIHVTHSMQQVAIYVRDVGTGMPQDVLTRIFDPFFTTKYRSSGLGLSVVHGVVEEHGGWVEVTSALDQGSCFAVFLPAIDQSTVSAVSDDFPAEQLGCGSGEHLLLVEDEQVVRRALGRELAREGYQVQAVGTAEEALAIYQRAPGHFDCVISDGLMPGMSGPEMVLEMLKVNAKQRAIFISGFASTMDCWIELQGHGCRLLAKPFGTNELLQALRETLAESREKSAPTVRNSDATH